MYYQCMGENRDKMLITFLGSSWQRGHVKLIFVPDLANVQI